MYSDGTQKQKDSQKEDSTVVKYSDVIINQKNLDDETRIILGKSSTVSTTSRFNNWFANPKYPTFETYIYQKDNDYMAGIKMSYTYNTLSETNAYELQEKEIYISMQPKEDGTATFTYEPPVIKSSNTKTIVNVPTMLGAFKAVSNYIANNQGKKYGRFFGLYRNSNSFVKKITKSVPGLKDAAQIHSTFTAKGAGNNIDKHYHINEGVPEAVRPNSNFKLNDFWAHGLRAELVNGEANLIDLLSTKQIRLKDLENNKFHGCSLRDILEDQHKYQKFSSDSNPYLLTLLAERKIKIDDLRTREKYGFNLEEAIYNKWISK